MHRKSGRKRLSLIGQELIQERKGLLYVLVNLPCVTLGTTESVVTSQQAHYNHTFVHSQPHYIYIYIYTHTHTHRTVNLMSRVLANGPGGRGSIPGRVIPKAQKMVLDVALLSTQHNKVCVKGEVEQFREWSSALLYTSVL